MGGVLLAWVVQLTALTQSLIVDGQSYCLHVHELVVGDGGLVSKQTEEHYLDFRGTSEDWQPVWVCCGDSSDRAERLIALFDDVLQLSQHCDLGVLQLQLLSGSIRYACSVGGLRFICLRAQT